VKTKSETPRDRARTRSRANILAAARELVLAEGVEALSLRAVAARAGFSPAGLYEYFDSKDDIVRGLAGEVAGQLDHRLAAVPVSLPAPRRLARLASAYLDFARDRPEDYLVLFVRLTASRTSPAQAAGGAYGRVLAAAEAGLADGSLEGGDAEEIAYAIWALVHGMAMLQLTHLKGYDADFAASDRKIIDRLVAGFSV
jgi:AcrR family transcriptional regulator